LPILASNIPENKEVLKRKDLLFQNKDSKDLKNKLRKFLSRPEELSEQAGKNKRIVSEEYDWEKLAREVEKVYSD